MSFFELLFYFLALFSILVIACIVFAISRGQRRTAWTIIRVYLVLAAVYGAALIAIALAMPLRVLVIGDTQYADDWSITTASLRRIPHDPDEDYDVDFLLSNHGDRAVNGPKGLTVYLLSEDGTRYDAAPEPSAPPFDVSVLPGKPIATTRKFVLPTNQNHVELVIERQGFRLAWFVIGRTPFDGHTVVHLQ